MHLDILLIFLIESLFYHKRGDFYVFQFTSYIR